MNKRKKHTLTISEAAKKKLVLNLPYCMIGLTQLARPTMCEHWSTSY